MKTNTKRGIAVLLSLIMCVALGTVSFAVDSTEVFNANAYSFIDTVEMGIADVLGAVEISKSEYGLGDVDFASLTLGKEIPSYELTENGLIRINDIHYFPILFNNEWVATAVISYSVYGDMNIELSAKYTGDYSMLKNSIVSNKSRASTGVALVFDSTNAYLYLDDESIVVESFQEFKDRASMNTYPESVCPATVQVIAQRDIETSHLELTRGSDEMVSLNITAIQQTTQYTCWAASVAMILNYRGTSATESSVVSASGVGWSSYQDAIQCSDLISHNASYGYPCGIGGSISYYGYYYRSNIYIENLKTELYYLSSPLFAGFSSGTVGHAVTVKGYVNLASLSTPTMTIIDPADKAIKALSVPTSGAVTMVYGGSTRAFQAAFAVYAK